MTKTLFPHFDNVRGQGDRISSAAEPSLLDVPESDEPYVDGSYGHTWSFTPKPGAAVYGKTDNFVPSPIDHLAKGRFLRVPFRRIPVIEIRSIEALQSFAERIISGDESNRLMWRGQTNQHFLKRSPDDLMRLYGSLSIQEPSMIPSAARHGLEFSHVFPAWAAILDVYLSERVERSDPLGRELENFRRSYNYRLWAFATAQHYGLPSVGLDVTPDLRTAVMFALHKFETDKRTGATTFRRIDRDSDPIVYAMGGFEGDLFDDEAIGPTWLQCARPKAQHAFFFGTGWGAASNKAAERVFVALRLLEHTTWRLPKSISELFPGTKADSLLAFLLRARERFPEIAEEARLSRIYYLA